MTHADEIDRQWMTKAACRGWDPELFFPKPNDRRTREIAQEICLECPVAEQCRRYARATDSHHGVWGGQHINEKTYRAEGTKPPKPHGTVAAVRRHQRRGEKVCHRCLFALSEDRRMRREVGA